MRKGRRVAALGGATAVLLAGVGAANALTLPSTLHQDNAVSPVAAPVNRVVVTGDSGEIVVQAGAAPQSQVSVHRRWNLAAPTVKQALSNGVLTVTSTCPVLPENNCAVDLTITVPAAVSVHAETAAGDVTTSHLRGDEDLRSAAGDVTATSITANSFLADSSAGTVQALLVSSPTSATATSDAGDVTLSVPAGAYAVRASTSAGEVAVTGITNQAGAPRHLTARSDAGDVTVKGH